MHQDYLLVVTHLGAATAPLIRAFTSNPETSLNPTPFIYSSPEELHSLKLVCNRAKTARVLIDILPYNYLLQSTNLSTICTFLYYLGDPRRTMTALIQEHSYTPTKAYDYYAFRLQRLAAMAKHTPKSFLLVWDDLNNDSVSKKLSSQLHLKNSLYFSTESADKGAMATGAIADKAVAAYEKYYRRIRAALDSPTESQRTS